MSIQLMIARASTGAVALIASVAAAAAITIELKDVAPDRIERQRRAATTAQPLPGTPDVTALRERLAAKGLEVGSEVFIRIFKMESELELWMRKHDRFVLLDTYPICHWSGTIGPKVREGDKQNPEGFYKIRRRQLHLAGRWPRSLNVGFPNPFDRALSRTGSYILIHGGCSSTGCFAMTNPVMQEIYGLTEAALREGQDYIDVHVFPFRMTSGNLEAHASNPWHEFWKNLKEGYDAFEATHVPPRVGVCEQRYAIEQVAPSEDWAPAPTSSNRRQRFAGPGDFACIRPAATVSETAQDESRDATPSDGGRARAKSGRRAGHRSADAGRVLGD